MSALKRQHGLATVEMAVIGAVMFMVLFAVIEFGRMLWSWETLAEATRRGARVAAVCPPFGNGAAVPARVALFRNTDGTGPGIMPGLDLANILVRYLDEDGATIATPACGNFDDIRYVEVSIQNYQINLTIPFVNNLVPSPDFRTTLAAENLGFVPDPADPTAPGFHCYGQATALCP